MKKRLVSILVAISMMLPLIPTTIAFAEPTALNSGKEIDQSVYDALGLKTDDSAGKNLQAPYGTGTSQLMSAREVYVSAVGNVSTTFSVRDGFNRMSEDSQKAHQTSDDGNLSGAYQFYGINKSSISADNGDTRGSRLSDNSSNVLAKGIISDYVIYATSTAFNMGSKKDNYLAELYAFNDNIENFTMIDGNRVKGKIEVWIYEIMENGNKYPVGSIKPKLNSNQTYSRDTGSYLTYFSRRYIQDLDAIFEVKATDMDGDGIDEIFVYTGRYEDRNGQRYALVEYFKKGKDAYESKGDIEIKAGASKLYRVTDPKLETFQWDYILRHPIVTLAGGDLNRDGKEELAVTVSPPNSTDDTKSISRAKVFEWKNNEAEPIAELSDILLNNGANALASANCTFGDFSLPNSSITGTALIMAGYQTYFNNTHESNEPYSKAGYRYVYFDPTEGINGAYKISDYTETDLGKRATQIAKTRSNGSIKRRIATPAPFALACADLEGMGASNNDDEILFGGDVYDFGLDAGLLTQIGSLSLCASQVNEDNNNMGKDQAWIGDITTGVIDTDPNSSETKWRESFLAVVGTRRAGDLTTNKDYYFMDISAFTLKKGTGTKSTRVFTSQEGVISHSNGHNDKQGIFVSLALPDIGDDSISMKYKDQYTVYTDPEVYAVLQASPYFSDLEESYGYLGNGGTAYSTSKGSGSSKGTSLSVGAGAYISAEVQLGGGVEMEAEVSAGVSYDYAKGTEVEYAVEYNNQAGSDDKVVMYTIPYVYYVYDQYNPTTKKWGPVILTTALSPITTVIDVEKYDEIAEQTDGLDVVRGNLIYNTPGQPASYTTPPSGTQKYAYKDYASVSNSAGADVSQSISAATTTEHSVEVYAEVNGKVGAGFALMGNKLIAGVVASSHAGFTQSFSSSKGTSYSGTVDNLPNEAGQYGFSWKLLVNQATLNGAPTWVVGYDVKGVSEPPRMPQNLSISNANADSIDLTWESSGNAAYYELSMVTQDGEYNKFATLPYTVNSHTVTELQPNTSYTFSIRAVNSKNATSIDSPRVTAYTLNDKANFSVLEQPSDRSAAAGLSATFSAIGQYLDSNGISKPIGYEWYHKTSNKSSWKKIPGANSSILKIVDVTPEMDGRQYRCRIYYQKQSLYTQPAMLIVDRSESKIMLDGLASNDIINSAGIKTEYTETVVSGRKTATIDKDDKTYMLNKSTKDSGKLYWSDGEAYYEFKSTSTLPALNGDGDVPKDFVFATDSIGSILDKAETNYTASFLNSTSQEMQEVTLVDANMDIAIPTFKDDEITYTAALKWTTQEAGFTSYAFYKAEATVEIDGENKTLTAYFYKKTADDTDVTDFSLGWTDTIDGIDISKLTTLFQVTETTTTQTEETTVAGETVTITASPKSADSSIPLEGNVTFAISGAGGETLAATKQPDGTYSTDWKPNAEGKYTITARFAGNNVYYSSESDPITVYTVMEDNAILTLTAPANLTYGNSATIATTQISDKDGSKTFNDVTESIDTTYVVKKLNEKNEYINAESGDYILSGNTFTPKLSSNFLISATNKQSTSEAVIAVNKGVLNIEAQNTTKSLNDIDRKPVAAKITGNASWDNISLTEGTDYKVTTEGEKATLPGTYTITVSLMDSDAMRDLSKNYSVQVKNATYTLESESYTVKATATANGSVAISYDNQGTSVAVESGTKLPENCKTTITATPALGYIVEKWEHKVNGIWKSITTDGSYVTSPTQVIEKLVTDAEYRVSFTPKYTTLTFSAKDSAFGSVSGNYLTNSQVGSSFQSGGNIHVNNTVRLTATPASDYAVGEWKIDRGDSNPEIIKVSGTDTNYTGTTYDMKSITTDTTVTVTFVKEKSIPVTIKPIDEDGRVLSNTLVKINGNTINKDEDGTYTYDGKTSENITIALTLPDGLLINSWAVGENQTTGSLSSDNCTMTVYNLTSPVDFTVKCSAPNKFEVGFTGTMGDASAFNSSVGSVTAIKVNSGNITSGDKQLQGSTIIFTAFVNSGYEIVNWTNNGKLLTDITNTSGTQKYQIDNLSGDISVKVTFRKKPTIIIPTVTNGTLTVNGTVDGNSVLISNGGYVDYNSDITVTLTPFHGYVVDTNSIPYTYTDGTGNTTDEQTYIISNVITNQSISGALKALPFVKTPFSVVEGNGTLSGYSYRKKIPIYSSRVTSDECTVYEEGNLVLTATADARYRVKEWKINGVTQSFTGNILTIPYTSLLNNVSVTVEFELGDPRITFTNPNNGVLTATSAGGDFSSGGTTSADIMFTVVPNENYEIKEWTVNGTPVGGIAENTYIYTNTGIDATVAAVLQGKSLAVTTTQDTGGNTNISSSSVRYNDSITITATPNDGYTFEGWYLNGTKIDTATATYTFVATQDAVYHAGFSVINDNTINFTVSDDEKGTISAKAGDAIIRSGDNVLGGTKVVFTVTPVAGYRVSRWDGLPAGTVYSPDKSTATISSLGDTITVTAVLEETPVHNITIVKLENGTITAQVDGKTVTQVEDGTVVTFTAIPNSYYIFHKWTEDASTQTEKSFTQAVTNDMTLGAVFDFAVSYTLRYSAKDGNGTVTGTSSGNAILENKDVTLTGGSKVLFTAVPKEGYMIDAWTVNDKVTSELSNNLTIENLKQNTKVEVSFKLIKLYSIPTSIGSSDYTISNVNKTPSDYGTESQIRESGTATFTVSPGNGKYFTALAVNGINCLEAVTDKSTENVISVVKGDNKDYIVTVSNVQKDIEVTISTATGDYKVTINPVTNGAVQVRKGETTVSSDEMVILGTELTITATPDSGYELKSLTVNGQNHANDTIYAAKSDITISATFGIIQSGGGIVPPMSPETEKPEESEPEKPTIPTQGEVVFKPQIDKDGNANATVSDKNITDVIKKAQSEAKKNGTSQNGISITIRLSTAKKFNSFTVNLSKSVLDKLASANVTHLTIDGGVTTTFDLNAIKQIKPTAKESVKIAIIKVNTSAQSAKIKTATNGRPVYNFKVLVGKKNITNFKSGKISIGIPYSLKKVDTKGKPNTKGNPEKSGNLIGVYVNTKGRVTYLANSSYDEENRTMFINTNHFSIYGVSYKQPQTTFADTANHPAKNDIAFAVARGLITDTTKNKFNPNSGITRGMFVAALGKLSNIDVTRYKTSSFTDVKANSNYLPYIEWAVENNIINEISKDKFAPDESITNEEIAVMLQAYIKTIGYKLPSVYEEVRFTDSEKISAWAKSAIKETQMAGILVAKDDGKFDPQSTVTRAELSTILRNLVNLVANSKTAEGWVITSSGKWMYFYNSKALTGKNEIGGKTYDFDKYGVTIR